MHTLHSSIALIGTYSTWERLLIKSHVPVLDVSVALFGPTNELALHDHFFGEISRVKSLFKVDVFNLLFV